MKKLVTFLLFLPLTLVAQNLDFQYEEMSCTESRAFEMIYAYSIGNQLDSESLLHIEEFELPKEKVKEFMMLLNVSGIQCNTAWSQKEYKKFLRESGHHFSRKFDAKVEAYCECVTENYSIFVWSVKGENSFGLLLTSEDRD